MDISELKLFFSRFAATFDTKIDDVGRNLRMKRAHTFRVVSDARKIMTAENFSPAEFAAGEKAALLHDLSRFEQYSRFRTFRDSESFDHGVRSAEICEERRLLAGDPAAGEILFAIRRHNQLEIGDAPSPFAQKIAQAVRDADKIDIFRVIFSFRNDPQVTFSLSDKKKISPEILAALREHRSADHRQMRSVTDFLAAKLQWFRELNFAESYRIAIRRDLLPKLALMLDGVPEIVPLIGETKDFLHRKGGVL
ncbi:MAG: HD domain-containing protein [Victivallaceae bacterium]|nr:HD domain-containing protein [Victivallaceae bacterium]